MTSSFDIGEKTERRLIDALKSPGATKPKWFIELQRASALLDMRGIDAIALVRYPGHDEPIRIPVQIKSSALGRDEYFEKHPDALAARVVAVVIRPEMTAREIRTQLFRRLREVRDDRVFYKEFFLRSITRPVVNGGTRIIAEIRERRSMTLA